MSADLRAAVDTAAEYQFGIDATLLGIEAERLKWAWDDAKPIVKHAYRESVLGAVAAAAPVIEAQTLRNWAGRIEACYPADVFIPPTTEWLAEVHSFCEMRGHTLDAISAHMMRHAANLARADAANIARGDS